MKTIASIPLPDSVRQSRHDRQNLRSQIAHFGFGAFHRADRALNAQSGDWGICEISLFSGVDLTAYADNLIVRFRNPALKQRT